MQVRERLEAEAVVLAAVACRPAVLDDSGLLAESEAWERLGRLVDARRVALAGEVAWRSREQLGDGSLARKQGGRDAIDLLARELRIGAREARRRTGLGLRVRAGLSMTGRRSPPAGATSRTR